MSEKFDFLLDYDSIYTGSECTCDTFSHVDAVPSPQSTNNTTTTTLLGDGEVCEYHTHLALNASTSHHSTPNPTTSSNKENRMSSINEPWFSTQDLLEWFAAEKQKAKKEIMEKKRRLLQLQLQNAEMKLKLYKNKMALETFKPT